jgi:AmiR/NasT family two-component response regulator
MAIHSFTDRYWTTVIPAEERRAHDLAVANDRRILNLFHLRTMRPEFLESLVEDFKQDSAQTLRQLGNAITNRNDQAYRLLLHDLVAASRDIGATRIEYVCRKASDTPAETRNQEIIATLEKAIHQVCGILKSYVTVSSVSVADRTDNPIQAERRTLLVAEDSRSTRALLREMLTPASYQLVEATTGKEALAICQNSPPDLLIVDLNLPDPTRHTNTPSGLDLARTVGTVIPFIVLTVDKSMDSLKAAIEAGAHAYIVKPPKPESLIPAIEVALAAVERQKNDTAEQTINQAIGIMMATYTIDQGQARQVIRSVASRERRKVYEVAQHIIQAQIYRNYLDKLGSMIEKPDKA